VIVRWDEVADRVREGQARQRGARHRTGGRRRGGGGHGRLPFCPAVFRDAFGTVSLAPPKRLDIAQIAAASIQSAAGRGMV